jgi:hypothetical protein
MTLDELIARAVRKAAQDIRVAMPARIISYDAGTRLARVQILVADKTEDGNTIPQPVITDVPVFMPIGGGAAITTPISAGDTGIVHFADQDIGGFAVDGDTSEPDTDRRHSLSDGMFVPGQGTGAADPTNVTISFGGATIIITPGGDVNIDSPGDVTINAAGGVNINSATLEHNGVNIGDDHVHGGITPGGANTAGPQ